MAQVAYVKKKADAFERGTEDGQAGPPEKKANDAQESRKRAQYEEKAESEANEDREGGENADEGEAWRVGIPLAFANKSGMRA